MEKENKAHYHLPGLFEFYDFYRVFLDVYKNNPEYFYEWCDIGSIYGAPADLIWGGGRVGFGDQNPEDVLKLVKEYQISARLTLSNSVLRAEHLGDSKCNRICRMFERKPGGHSKADDEIASKNDSVMESRNDSGITDRIDSEQYSGVSSGNDNRIRNGIIVHSDILLDYLKEHYPGYYFVSSTTKVLTDPGDFLTELERPEFSYVVPDFRLNKAFDILEALDDDKKTKVEFLCNECCDFDCQRRKACYENVSRKCLGEEVADHICGSDTGNEGYKFSRAMKSPAFIGVEDIKNVYLPMGFTNFKIEGRSLGSAMLLEFILHYMTKPEYQIHVREKIYLDCMLDLF